MNPLQQYLNTRVAIHCFTQEEANLIGKLIKDAGGSDLSANYHCYEEDFAMSLEKVSSGRNEYCSATFYRDKYSHIIVPASSILELINGNYSIF